MSLHYFENLPVVVHAQALDEPLSPRHFLLRLSASSECSQLSLACACGLHAASPLYECTCLAHDDLLTEAATFLQITTGAAAEFEDLKIILAHAGGFIPFVASRLGMAATAIEEGGLANAGVSFSAIDLLKRFYVDTALSSEHPSLRLAVLQT